MKVLENADLAKLNTFGVAARARLLVTVESEEDILQLPVLDSSSDLLLGGGSNILFIRDVPGTVICNRIGGIEIIEDQAEHLVLEVGAGENWHSLVEKTVAEGWHGLENLALIPGLAGAAPIQNIGAYGVELAEVLESVTAWDWQRHGWVVFSPEQCLLGYRDSLFKQEPRDRFLITSIRLRLRRNYTPRLEYAGLRDYLQRSGVPITARAVFDAVVSIRQEKLPDPARQGNAGSFFKNPVIHANQAEDLLNRFPGLPHWPQQGSMEKISAAWLIEAAGLKGKQAGAAAVSSQHALVLVNCGGATGQDIWQLACEVQQEVAHRFGITLEPEPRIYPSFQELP